MQITNPGRRRITEEDASRRLMTLRAIAPGKSRCSLEYRTQLCETTIIPHEMKINVKTGTLSGQKQYSKRSPNTEFKMAPHATSTHDQK
jgi:hypothetical protein